MTRTSGDAREGPGTSIHALTLRIFTRVFLPLAILGLAGLIAGIKTGSAALKVSGWIALGLAAPILVHLLVFFGTTILVPKLTAGRERRRLLRALTRLDAAENGTDQDAFRSACVHVREMFGASSLDERLLDPRRAARERYLAHATAGALEKLARRTDDPLARRSWLEGVRRRDSSFAEPPREELERAWKSALDSPDLFRVPGKGPS